jgi:hypothetical protein
MSMRWGSRPSRSPPAARRLLELNGVEASGTPSNDDVFDLVMWAAPQAPDLEDIASRVKALLCC